MMTLPSAGIALAAAVVENGRVIEDEAREESVRIILRDRRGEWAIVGKGVGRGTSELVWVMTVETLRGDSGDLDFSTLR